MKRSGGFRFSVSWSEDTAWQREKNGREFTGKGPGSDSSVAEVKTTASGLFEKVACNGSTRPQLDEHVIRGGSDQSRAVSSGGILCRTRRGGIRWPVNAADLKAEGR
jgi:hypothetical protein